MAKVSFLLPMVRCEATGKGSLILCEWVIWAADNPACICYPDNQRWLLCVTLFSEGIVLCDCSAVMHTRRPAQLCWR